MSLDLGRDICAMSTGFVTCWRLMGRSMIPTALRLGKVTEGVSIETREEPGWSLWSTPTGKVKEEEEPAKESGKRGAAREKEHRDRVEFRMPREEVASGRSK